MAMAKKSKATTKKGTAKAKDKAVPIKTAATKRPAAKKASPPKPASKPANAGKAPAKAVAAKPVKKSAAPKPASKKSVPGRSGRSRSAAAALTCVNPLQDELELDSDGVLRVVLRTASTKALFAAGVKPTLDEYIQKTEAIRTAGNAQVYNLALYFEVAASNLPLGPETAEVLATLQALQLYLSRRIKRTNTSTTCQGQ